MSFIGYEYTNFPDSQHHYHCASTSTVQLVATNSTTSNTEDTPFKLDCMQAGWASSGRLVVKVSCHKQDEQNPSTTKIPRLGSCVRLLSLVASCNNQKQCVSLNDKIR